MPADAFWLILDIAVMDVCSQIHEEQAPCSSFEVQLSQKFGRRRRRLNFNLKCKLKPKHWQASLTEFVFTISFIQVHHNVLYSTYWIPTRPRAIYAYHQKLPHLTRTSSLKTWMCFTLHSFREANLSFEQKRQSMRRQLDAIRLDNRSHNHVYNMTSTCTTPGHLSCSNS